MSISDIDKKLISFFGKAFIPTARFGLFVVFFWFGFLKIINMSPASDLVKKLFEETVPVMTFDTFLVLFGVFECVIGLLFLVRGLERIVIPLLFLHMVTTFMPLFLLTSQTWTAFMVPTLEGQYIIKNLLIIAAAIGIAAHVHPIKGR